MVPGPDKCPDREQYLLPGGYIEKTYTLRCILTVECGLGKWC